MFTDALNDLLSLRSRFRGCAACPSQRRIFRLASIPTVRKINLRFRIASTWWFDRRSLELAQMPPGSRELSKNYIGIVSDRTDEPLDSVAKSDRLTKKYLLGLMAAVLSRVADARK